jgi:hypothetical protein
VESGYRSEEHPKMASIVDYWDEQTMTEIQALLREYEDMFPKRFSKLKGIKGDLGEMRIDLKIDVNSIKHRPYHLNLSMLRRRLRKRSTKC